MKQSRTFFYSLMMLFSIAVIASDPSSCKTEIAGADRFKQQQGLQAQVGQIAKQTEEPTGLCASNEDRFFVCMTAKKRWISLCGGAGGALQYRYGNSNKVELQYPEAPADGKNKLLFAHYNRPKTDRVEVGFNNNSVDYAIFDYSEDKQRQAGIRVTTADGKVTEIVCVGRVFSRLGELKSVLRCDVDNALNGGLCSK